MKVASVYLLLISMFLAPAGILAGDKDEIEAVRAELLKMVPMAKDMNIEKTEVEGVFRGELNGTYMFAYASDGHVLIGDLLNTETKENLGEVAAAQKMAEEVATVSTDEMIVFSSEPNASLKGRYITVFTDIDCGYCRKLHDEVPALNAAGLEVRYLAYPRAGVGSSSYKKYVSVWCNADQQESMTRAKSGKSVDEAECDNPIAKTFNLGRRIGVRGTPTIVFDDGRMLPGYLPATELLKRI